MAKQRDLVTFLDGGESCLDRLVVGNAFWIHAFRDAYDFLRHRDLLLFHYLEVAYDVDGRLRCNEGEFVEFLVFKELVGYLDDSLAAIYLAGKVDTDCYLTLHAFEIEYVKGFVYIVGRNVI